MINPLYSMSFGNTIAPQSQQLMTSGMPMFQNPMQKMNYILQAMQNPAAFVKQNIPNLPQEIANDPNQILQYLQRTYGITNQQIQQAAMQIPRFR